MSRRPWYAYGSSKDGAALYGLAVDEQRRLMLGRIDIAAAKEPKIADFGPAPSASFDAAFSEGQLRVRGFIAPGWKELSHVHFPQEIADLPDGRLRPPVAVDRPAMAAALSVLLVALER